MGLEFPVRVANSLGTGEKLMRPKGEPAQRQRELFQIDLEQLIDLSHPLVRLGRGMDWSRRQAIFELPPSSRATRRNISTLLQPMPLTNLRSPCQRTARMKKRIAQRVIGRSLQSLR